jgi:SAM-dependent methyltransferase
MDDWTSFDSAAEVYARVFAPRFAEPAADLVRIAEITDGQRILDLGTGTGAALRAAIAAGASGFGADASALMLASARRSDPHARLAQSDAAELPFGRGSFDVVTSNFVLHLVRDPKIVLAEVRRVLNSGGRFGCTTWADTKDELATVWRECLLSAIDEELLDDVMERAAPGRERLSERGGLEELLLDAGFRHLWVERREYRFLYRLDEYVDGLAVTSAGRFLSQMLRDDFGAFMERTRETFRSRFADPLNDFESVWLAVARSE